MLGAPTCESFLHRMAYLDSTGESSRDAGTEPAERSAVLARIRALGLTRPGGPAAGLGDDFTLACGDIPPNPNRRTLPGPAPGDHAAALRAPGRS